MQKQQKEIEKLPGVCRSLPFNLDHPLSLKPPPRSLLLWTGLCNLAPIRRLASWETLH